MPLRPAIIAAVDLDGAAVGIVRRAARLASRCDGELAIFHAVDHRPGHESDQVPLIPAAEVEAEMVRYAHAWLIGLLHHLDVPNAVVVVKPGRPVDTLCELAATLHPLYVVVGRSRWGLFRPFSDLSGALERRGCDCDLLVIAPGDESTNTGLSDGARSSGLTSRRATSTAA
jgi:nucleotide-binding universal stress UspA family protein